MIHKLCSMFHSFTTSRFKSMIWNLIDTGMIVESWANQGCGKRIMWVNQPWPSQTSHQNRKNMKEEAICTFASPRIHESYLASSAGSWFGQVAMARSTCKDRQQQQSLSSLIFNPCSTHNPSSKGLVVEMSVFSTDEPSASSLWCKFGTRHALSNKSLSDFLCKSALRGI